MVETCHAKTDRGFCDCEEHSPSPANPSLCEECGHGKSKHPKKASASSLSECKTVSEIFKKKVAGISDSVSYSDARKDALKGFKEPSSSSNTSSKKVRIFEFFPVVLALT